MGSKNIILSEVPAGKELWIFDGTICKNIYELRKALKRQDEWTFKYHVNSDNQKNDYAKWVMDVLGDRELGNKLLRLPESKQEFERAVSERIAELED